MVWCKSYFDILKRLGVTREFVGETDSTDRYSDSKRRTSLRCAQKQTIAVASSLSAVIGMHVRCEK